MADELQSSLFEMSGGSISGNAPEHHSGDGGSTPTPPLQPKQLIIKIIDHSTARNIWLNRHYLHRDFANPSLELGVFSPDMTELVGAIAFSARLGGSVKGGTPHIWEIRRMWLSDERCARNCESRVLSISCRMVKFIAPHVRVIISYSDITKMQHKGTIYKAAGFSYDGMTNVAGGKGWITNPSHKAADNWNKKRWMLPLFRAGSPIDPGAPADGKLVK